MEISPAVLALAEDTNSYGPLPPGAERVVTDEYVVYLSARKGAPFTVVQRLRLTPERVEPVVAALRRELAARDRAESTWEVGSSATPPGLADRLVALGMRPFAEPLAVAMVLVGAPPPPAVEATARRVASLDEYRAAREIGAEVFGSSRVEPEQLATEWAAESGGGERATYLAFLGDEPVGMAAARPVGGSLVLDGAAVLERARGRGAFRALVDARAREAQAAGLSALVVQAGARSRPILRRLGFVETAEIRILEDGFRA